MQLLSPPARQVLQHPLAFARRVVTRFGDNQGLLLAGAVAYYALLSVVPLLALSVTALSHLVDQAELLSTIGRYLEWLVPSQSKALLGEVSGFIENRIAIGAVLLVTMLFFSSLAFSVLQKSMAVIFAHRHAIVKRHPLIAAILPYSFVLLLSIALLAVTLVSVVLQTIAQESLHLFGQDWSLSGLSGLLFYLLGLGMETLIFTAIYLVMPIGRTRLSHALIGGGTATAIWEVVRHVLVWYFTTLSKASVVYGSLTTAVVALFSMEISATLLLLGAQVIAEYERIGME
ncbi:MAG TPA: YihY/virulence factor BrkB family protein [Rhodocyclaceae bacterium]